MDLNSPSHRHYQKEEETCQDYLLVVTDSELIGLTEKGELIEIRERHMGSKIGWVHKNNWNKQ